MVVLQLVSIPHTRHLPRRSDTQPDIKVRLTLLVTRISGTFAKHNHLGRTLPQTPTMSADTQFDSALYTPSAPTDLHPTNHFPINRDLLRRLPPSSTSANLTRLCSLAPHLTEDLLSSVDQPLEVRRCKKTGRDYLLCDYNRDGDSWRSPWSNEFEPLIEDEEGGVKPSERVRGLEVRMGEGVDVYREL